MTHCNLDMTKYGKGMQRECILYIDSRDHDGSWHIPGMRPETCTRFSGLVMGEGPFQSRLQCQLQTSSSGGSRRNQLAGCVKRVNSLALGQSRIVS
jgi:hypothetical protein